MANNPVAANLLMFVVVVGGLIGLSRVKQEIFPEFDMDMVKVAVSYPGASPSEVEQGIVLAVEEAVRGLDGVKYVHSIASEGNASVVVELLLDADVNQVLADVKSAVDQITSFPGDSEEPSVSLVSRRQAVISLIVSGQQELSVLHALGERVRNDLLSFDDITQVELGGVPPMEISVEIRRQDLEKYGLILEDVARQIEMSSLELPGGGIDTQAGEILLRLADRKISGAELGDIVIRSTGDGAMVRLADIATIDDGYADTDQAACLNGEPAIRVTAYRIGDERPLTISDLVREYAAEMAQDLPDTVHLTVWDDESEKLNERIDLLLDNGAIGFVLVVLVLALFLRLRLAIWVALGIPVSFLGAFFLMPGMDQSINMLSLFALILTLGMVVDDAIVVGENAHSKMQGGMGALEASIAGAREMAVPVAFAVLTTMAAFMPLFFIPGTMGKVFRLFPILVTTILAFSLLESFFVLPAHLAHPSVWGTRLFAWSDRFSLSTARALESFSRKVYRPTLEWVLSRRYLSLSIAWAFFFLSVGVVSSGLVPFNFFPSLEGDVVTVSARLPYGVALQRTLDVQQQLEESLDKAIEESGGMGIVRGIYTRLGEGVVKRFNPMEVGSHVVSIEVQLVPSAEREVSAESFSASWAGHTPQMIGVEALTFNSAVGPGAGSAVDVQLSHSDPAVLAPASRQLSDVLHSYSDLRNIENEYASGKTQLDFHLLPRATSLGLTSDDIARQLRAAFYGVEAYREQRGRNEIKIMVRLPEEQRASEYDLDSFLVRTAGGDFVPLHEVARYERSRAPTSIIREDGKRIVHVSAELKAGVPSPRNVLESLQTEVFPEIENNYAGLGIELVGQQREQQDTFDNLAGSYLVAIFAIFALIAIPFRSYLQPLIVMSVIPFGFVGALLGHILMGYDLSLVSFMGMVALSGVVVNDSLVLVHATNGLRARGQETEAAVISGGMLRLRAILLTSITTFLGLAPMIMETSIQARFLVPMAISLGFGVLFATIIVLLLVPALYMALEDLKSLFHTRILGRGSANTLQSGQGP